MTDFLDKICFSKLKDINRGTDWKVHFVNEEKDPTLVGIYVSEKLQTIINSAFDRTLPAMFQPIVFRFPREDERRQPSKKTIRTQLQKLRKSGNPKDVDELMNRPREEQVAALQAARGRGGRGQGQLLRGSGRGDSRGGLGGRGHFSGRARQGDRGGRGGRGYQPRSSRGAWSGGAGPNAPTDDDKKNESPKKQDLSPEMLATLVKTPGMTPEMIAAIVKASNQ